MNQTKKITQGAMMLAIVGAMILIDRMTAYWFTEFVVLIIPIVIIMYSAMHTLKDGALLSVGLLIISFLLGNFQLLYLIYVPVGILTGLAYAWGIEHNKNKRWLLFSAMFVYTVGELLATFIIYPLLGFPVAQMIEEYKIAMNQAGSFTGTNYSQIFSAAGLDFGKMIGILYVVSTIIMGAMEGVLIHLLSVFLLKRFKIKDLGRTTIYDIKPNPPLAYAALLATSSMFVAGNLNNETLYYACIILAMFGVIVLMYYGYIFLVLYGVVVLHRNVGALFVLMCFFIPGLFIFMLILGFLYGSGPLRSYLDRKIRENMKPQS